ncbi:hypothetical protein GCM10010387_56470 [Streptomyces inusitatus]|uniref:Uncharacterized protein n=1 Tax=Streptomyces inusitatus TaxID=68221 RepID=A0A918V0X6_9ACTN|nr:hypothetical protein GCM10010387_56470 [Streptomyces inusitatus]
MVGRLSLGRHGEAEADADGAVSVPGEKGREGDWAPTLCLLGKVYTTRFLMVFPLAIASINHKAGSGL